ncbi:MULTISPECIES: hypothetical protein [unclassified Nocardioides]|uniref:hypothetical protein n=1 Tax=unclassified Nocardioides TaxID=2615069 RepID=UPI0006F23A8E|nr:MULTISPECIES: hypothetical protein [unclassified Nocardioides]KRA37904.1 hypothetical protein ASD81_04260 [Nocardioides sp. Root614]KRA91864.1 hypothetical protein ASD84_04525 [Nocardioides sp. Root682]
MLLAHAVTLSEARSYVAALADNARTFDASVGYEYVLFELDRIHGAEIPPITEVLTDKRDVLYTVAEAAIEELVDHGVDGLQVELVLARLEDARALDRP